MKIANSAVSMESSHNLTIHASERKAVVEARPGTGTAVINEVAAIYQSSGSSMVSAMDKFKDQKQRSEKQQQKAQEWANAQQALTQMRQTQPQPAGMDLHDRINDIKRTLLAQLLEALSGKAAGASGHLMDLKKGNVLDLRGAASRTAGLRSQLFGGNSYGQSANALTPGTSSAGTLWQRITATSASYTEREDTTFQSRGFAVTEDGRSIGFDVAFSMSRSFSASYESLTSQSFIMTDPLIINLDSNTTSVSDVKFRFDLDSDGTEEEISFAGEGSGFLALDLNENGVIDDGSELFGTKSGDGFADLAAYDDDGNNWIDENDAVYSKLRVWTKDADGNDRLMDLKEANVGAIYLGSASTEFSLKDADTNETNGVVRRSGVYLKETGEAGTLSHVDLRC